LINVNIFQYIGIILHNIYFNGLIVLQKSVE